ncbi:LysR family transcriptional regulator [Rhodococcus sp. PSBB049]|uniref:LysR family transcriptional regulator n=1 Tax=Rhodococcus sp. PSBB049 TaxID=2812863 RepID=UPI00197EEC83|nr:LysR family transcriptional regulator [Rhodococcus sp. PSBB049]QSE72421.1 LysR family transcriptional regulator [Rhodococcus sp. PSBB049]
MELRQLAYFVTVAEEASFTRAAARLHTAQSGVSAQVRQLERELGQPLLDRTTRTVRLTQVGAEVLPYARAALSAAAGMRRIVDEYSGLLRGHVSVGTVASSSMAFDLSAFLTRFHRDHPAIGVSVSEAASDMLVDTLLEGRLDAAVIAPVGSALPGLHLEVVADEPLVAAVRHDDPWSDRHEVTLAELGARPLISFPRSVGARIVLEDSFAAVGIVPRVDIEAGDPQVLADLAAGGLGVAVLPEPYAASRRRLLHILGIACDSLRGRLALAWPADGPRTPAAGALIAQCRGAHVPIRPADTAWTTDRAGGPR